MQFSLSLFYVLCAIRLRVSVLEAFDPLLLNDSSETTDQGKLINQFQKPHLYCRHVLYVCMCLIFMCQKKWSDNKSLAMRSHTCECVSLSLAPASTITLMIYTLHTIIEYFRLQMCMTRIIVELFICELLRCSIQSYYCKILSLTLCAGGCMGGNFNNQLLHEIAFHFVCFGSTAD